MRAKLDKLTGNLRESDLPSGVDLPAMQQQAHRHDNKSVLDKIGEADGQLLFDGAAVGGGEGGGSGDMLASVYDTNGDGKVDAADTADSVGTTTAAQVADAVRKAHEHSNKTTLDKFAEQDGALTFNGQPVGGGTADSVAWENVTGKPSTFPPETHQHAISDVTGLQDALDSVATQTENGLMSAADKVKLDGLGGVATQTENGLMSKEDKAKLDGISRDFFGDSPFLEFNNAGSLLLKSGTALSVGDVEYSATADIELDVADLLDTGTIQAGKDYCVYITTDQTFVVSLNSTFPSGTLSDGSTAFSAENTRKIGGFHTLCADAGEIDGHPLSGFSAGDILPASVWCLNHRPFSEPAGMVYCEALDFWVDIYLQSGTGEATESVFGGTITHTRCQPDHTEDMFSVRKKLLSDEEFSAAADGSNQQTAVSGGSVPATTGGHIDTAGRRMISGIGCEDFCGFTWEWLRETGPSGGKDQKPIPGGKGNFFGNVYGLIAGGYYGEPGISGSRARNSANELIKTTAGIVARGMSYNRNREE